jgi:RNA polymerase sigma factor (sigma-70 family)
MNGIKDLLVGEYSERAFRMIVNAYQDKVIRFISLFVSSRLECEELASDVFISLWKNKESLADVSDLDNYIFIVAKNKALNHLRKGKAELDYVVIPSWLFAPSMQRLKTQNYPIFFYKH